MFPNLDDPKKLALMQMAFGLLGGAPGQRGNFGADLGHAGLLGVQGYQQGKQFQTRQQEEEQQRQMRQMQMDAMKREQENQAKFGQAFQSAFAPNQNLVQNDDMGNPMPSSGGGGMPDLIRQVGQFDPRMALSMMPKPQGPVTLSEGAQLVDPATGRQIAHNPKPQGPKEGDTREIKSGSRILTYEFTKGEWKKIGDSAQFKPDKPDRPTPQLIDTPQGQMWVTPPTGGVAGATPVIGPDGKPVQSKQSAKEAKDAEKEGIRTKAALERADFVLGKVGDAIKQTGFMSTGAMGQLTRNLGGTPAFNLNKTVDSIKANIGFAELQAMREASPTGGALGNVAIQELNMLQSVLGSLDTAQDDDQLLKSLYSIEKHYRNWQQAVKQAQSQGAGGGTARRYNPQTGKIE